MKAENFIELIEQRRFDKISKNGMTLIAERFRELQNKQLTIPVVVAKLPNIKSTEFKKWLSENNYTPTLNGLWHKKEDKNYGTDTLYKYYCNLIEFGN